MIWVVYHNKPKVVPLEEASKGYQNVIKYKEIKQSFNKLQPLVFQNPTVSTCLTIPRSSLANGSKLEEVDMVLSLSTDSASSLFFMSCVSLRFFSNTSWNNNNKKRFNYEAPIEYIWHFINTQGLDYRRMGDFFSPQIPLQEIFQAWFINISNGRISSIGKLDISSIILEQRHYLDRQKAWLSISITPGTLAQNKEHMSDLATKNEGLFLNRQASEVLLSS